METQRFDYELPAERIAQRPAAKRDASRLLVVNRASGSIEHRRFKDLPDYCQPGDRFFRNTARVLPARLFGQRPTGGQVECLLLKPSDPEVAVERERWWCLLKPGRKLPPGSVFGINGAFQATVLEKNPQGEYLVAFQASNGQSVKELAQRFGKMPLPPYIQRERQDLNDETDKDRYQTVYAQEDRAVAAAAPTAGLHFTDELSDELVQAGSRFYDLILHVGMGTFKPLGEGSVEAHEIHREIYEIPQETQEALRNAPSEGMRRICVGTTSVRSIEDYLGKADEIATGNFVSEAGIFIYPPAEFKGVDALITNFHLPKSTLLCLASAFLSPGRIDGIDWLKEIYAEAISKEYRFLSYGDAMLIL
ncbi:MAG: tRNA preQ1(34) S-adenosylmethionine ribosyltransferase-isomerase QueA [Opitutaceae bacterium]|nr:tRNA preQ1(34) S-adenosylmethionine ribosyltransferase-isomerase QueA [Opitutaceae bacterium]